MHFLKIIRKKFGFVVASIILIVGIFGLGLYVGYSHRPYSERVTGLTNKTAPEIAGADFESFWKVWHMIDEKYPGADKVTKSKRIEGAISGLVSSLDDPYSVFFPPEESKNFEDTISGSFEGVGMEVGIKNKILTVIAPLKNTPAEKAGIKAGDFILKIDDTATTDMTVEKAVRLIRGKQGTSVRFTIVREGLDKPKEITVTRGVIEIPTLDAKERSDGVFVITLYNFSANSAPLMENALRSFVASGSNKLIIDLRNNPGGYLDSAVQMASFFLPEGEVVVTEDFGKNGDPRIYRSRGYKLLDMKKIHVAILVDRGSASASEILSGALNEHGVAPLIGEKTYGKGSVQEVMDVTDTTTLKLTVAKWLTPNGISISEHGLPPTIPVEVTEQDVQKGSDPVLLRAVDYLKTGK